MTVIDNAFAQMAEPQKAALQHIREIVHTLAPDAEEVMTYGMPGFKYKGRYLIAFTAFKDHLSLFPTSAPVEAFQNKLSDFKLSKGTIQFTVEKPIPDELVRDIVRYQMAAIAHR